MSSRGLSLRGRNPDVLNCIANLSSDEVITPPEVVRRMLDEIGDVWALRNGGACLWSDPSVKFIDPCTKSGVFLREITSRLTVGLAEFKPNLQERVDHILSHQVYGIGITRLTAMMSRRTLYCSKDATSDHSISGAGLGADGNVWFQRTEHEWVGKKCKYCGAPRESLDRTIARENYAYPFIHAEEVETLIEENFGGKMHFDIVIGNPPYHMKDGAGGTNDASIYHLFVEQAKKLEPKYLSMIIPSRWLAGGRGLGDFRKHMLGSGKISRLVDYPVAKEVFPNIDLKGGVCFFVWSENYEGPCNVSVIRDGSESTSMRVLNEFDVFIRSPTAVAILNKVIDFGEESITSILTADTPFGLATNFADFEIDKRPGDIFLHYKSGERCIGHIRRSQVRKNRDLIDRWKVLVPKAGSDGGLRIPDVVLGRPHIAPPPSAATQTFLAFHVDCERAAKSVESYYKTKFFRHLVSLRKLTQDASQPMYNWVPVQQWNKIWSDQDLYEKYGLSSEEIDYIERVISPME